MNRIEIRNSLILAMVFALRMLGLFIILPIFSVYAQNLPSGDHLNMVGWVMGIYGLVQACFHIPLGVLSDRVGRKPVIIGGLSLFVLGGVIAAISDSLLGIAIGRAIQGAGAISAAITAMIADLTREEHRSKAMAIIGGSIGLAFALSLIIAAPLYHHIGMHGIFWGISMLGLGAIVLVLFTLPSLSVRPSLDLTEQVLSSTKVTNENLLTILKRIDLWRLNLGVLILHIVQMAMFIVVPRLLIAADLPLPEHWKIYLPVILGSFFLMWVPMLIAERAGKTHLILICAITLLFLVQIIFGIYISNHIGVVSIALLLLLFFTGFNLLEALQPALVSRLASRSKGAALGVYNTTQALGLFLGGVLGGSILKFAGSKAVFFVCACLLFVWLIIIKTPQQWLDRRSVVTPRGDVS